MMPRGERARLLLRGLAKFVAVVVVAGAVGTLLGIAISQLTGEDDSRATIAPPPTATALEPTAQDPLAQVRVTVGSAVLHPARSASGQRRKRARLGVGVRVENRGKERVVLPRPSLLAANQRVPTDAAADRPATHVGSLNPGQTTKVTLAFETAGAVTAQLTTQKRARVLVAGRSRPFTLTVGTPARSSAQSGTTAP